MEADVIIDNETVVLQGSVVAIADTNELKVTGNVSGYAFVDRTNQANRFVLYANENKVHIWSDDKGDMLSVSDGEIETKGENSSYAFHDRSNPINRFVLYAADDKVRFWKEGVGDILFIDADGSVRVPKRLEIGMLGGHIEEDTIILRTNSQPPNALRNKSINQRGVKSIDLPLGKAKYTIDLVEYLYGLQEQILDLKIQLNKLQ